MCDQCTTNRFVYIFFLTFSPLYYSIFVWLCSIVMHIFVYSSLSINIFIVIIVTINGRFLSVNFVYFIVDCMKSCECVLISVCSFVDDNFELYQFSIIDTFIPTLVELNKWTTLVLSLFTECIYSLRIINDCLSCQRNTL